MLIAYPAYQAFACPTSEDKQCRSPRCWSVKTNHGRRQLFYPAEAFEVAKFDTPQIKRLLNVFPLCSLFLHPPQWTSEKRCKSNHFPNTNSPNEKKKIKS